MGLTQTHAVLLVTDSIPLWVYGFITVIAILLVGSVILLTICMTWRLAGKEYAGASSLLFPMCPPFLPQPHSLDLSCCV